MLGSNSVRNRLRSWTENDAVNINGKGFTAKNVDGEGKATFEGEAVTPDADGKYKAIFPADYYQDRGYVLPATQTYAANNNLSGVNPMYAESETTELQFQSICALMKLTLTNNSYYNNFFTFNKLYRSERRPASEWSVHHC